MMKLRIMNFLAVTLAMIALGGAGNSAFAQADTNLVNQFLTGAQAAADGRLGDIASELTGKIESLGAALGTNSVLTSQIDTVLKSLTGGQDSTALSSAFKLVSAAKLTPEQVDVARQVGNLASAYVVQKNFASLDGAQGDVASIVSSLRDGQITTAIPAIKNVATNAHLTDDQKTLITKIADQYAPGWKKAGAVLDGLKKLPGF
jgi:hypothetical protein